MSYIQIINNSEKYITMLKEIKTETDKIYIKYTDIKPSDYLVKISDPLWGYYDVTTFIINEKQVNTNEIFLNYKVICGDFFCGEGFIQKIDCTITNKEWNFLSHLY